MKIIVITINLLILISYNINAQDCTGTNKKEKNVLELINALPEVVKENGIREKQHLSVLLKAYIQYTPTNTDDCYYVTISEEKGEKLFTYDWYKVNSHNYVISYYDVINGKTIPLKEWLSNRKHLFKQKKIS